MIPAPTVGTFMERAAETSTAVSYPATVAANDFLFLTGSVFNAGLVTLPAGWTSIASFSSTGNTLAPDIFAAYKFGVGTEGGTTVSVTHNNNVSNWQILGFSGVDLVTPLDVAVSTVDQTTAVAGIAIPGVTPVTPGCALVYAAANLNTANTATPPTAPATFTETGDRSTGTRDSTVGYLLNQPASATGTVTVTFSGTGRGLGILVALRPASAARPIRVLTPARFTERWWA